MSHTKAPWIADNSRCRTAINSFDMHIAMVNYSVGCSEEEHVANVNLIAAAPDLLEACELIASLCPHNDSTTAWNAAFKMVREAVAKARGLV